jgi:hypothetical protein
MPKLTPVSWRNLVTRLQELGFEGPYLISCTIPFHSKIKARNPDDFVGWGVHRHLLIEKV